MNAHTPGPWLVSDENMDDISAERSGKVVVYGEDCELHPIADFRCNTSCRPIEEQEANAKLASAAPKLLEALQKEQEWHDRMACGAIDPEWDYETMVGQYRRAAIAEATS